MQLDDLRTPSGGVNRLFQPSSMRSAHKLCRHIFVMAVMTSVTSTDQFRREAHLYVYAATHNQLVLQEDHELHVRLKTVMVVVAWLHGLCGSIWPW